MCEKQHPRGHDRIAQLDLYEEVDREVALAGRRWVISHIGVISRGEIEKIARMELVLTTHTNNYLYRGLEDLARRLPPERHRDINPLRSLIEAGVKVSLATDNVPVSPFLPIAQAIVREPFGGRERVAPSERLGRADALRCATGNGAWLTFDEGCKGSLEPGKLADLALLSADPLEVEEGCIADIRSLMTMVGGASCTRPRVGRRDRRWKSRRGSCRGARDIPYEPARDGRPAAPP